MEGSPKAGRLLGRIGTRILAAMLLAALVPLIVAAYQGYHCARQALVEEVQNRLLAIARGRRDRIQSWLNERISDVKLLEETHCFWECRLGLEQMPAPDAGRQMCSCLESFRQHSDCYEAIALLDAPNRIVAKVGAFPQNGVEAGFWRQMVDERRPTASALIREREGQFILLIGGRLRKSIGDAGYVVAYIDACRALAGILGDTSGLGRSGVVRLATEGGKWLRLHCAATGHTLREHPAPSLGLREALRRKETVARYPNEDGVEVVSAHVEIPELRCVLVMEMETREALRWLRVLRLRALLMAAATFAVVFAGARGLARKLAAPLAQLAQAARRVGQGTLDQPVEVEGGEEVVEVAHAFNQMMEGLKASQEALVKSAGLAAVGELSASVVHEMRNPLSSVKMNLQAVMKKVEDDPLHLELMEIAFAQVDRIERMLTDLLDFGKPLDLRLERQSIQPAVEEALQTCKPAAQAKHVALVAAPDAVIPDVAIDRERLTQALVNLLNNAIEASGQESTVIVSVGARREGPVSEVGISISDEGPGIPDEARQQLFTPFFTTKPNGTGLGLANVRKIVDLHRGRVEAENRSEGGARFTVCLPAKEES